MSRITFTYELKDRDEVVAQIDCWADCDWNDYDECVEIDECGFDAATGPASPEWQEKLSAFFRADPFYMEKAENEIRSDRIDDGDPIPYEEPYRPRVL